MCGCGDMGNSCVFALRESGAVCSTFGAVCSASVSCAAPVSTLSVYGLALKYLSNIVRLGFTILVAHSLRGMFGVALGALDMLGTLTMG